MKTKESKAQLEVWEWKEKLSKELNKIPAGKRIDYILKKTAELTACLKIRKAKLQPLSK